MRIFPSVAVLLLMAWPVQAQEPMMTCIEQDVVRERVEGQPALKGEQRICFTDKQIRNEIRFGDRRSIAFLDIEADRIVLIPGGPPEYVELPLGDYQRLVAMRLEGSGLNDPEAVPKLTTTDETRKIGDWNCRKVVFEQVGRMKIRTELWITTDATVDFQAWLSLMERLGLLGALGRLGQQAKQIEGLPVEVRAEQTITDQLLITTTLVKRITKEPVGADTFKIPEGHQRIEAGAIP